MVITKNSDTELSVSLTGTATNSNNTNDITNLRIAFNNTAFNEGDASGVTNSTKSNLDVDFIQQVEVAISGGDYTTITAAIAASEDRDIINIAEGTYTEPELTVNKDLTFLGAGAAATIIQAHALENTATHRVFYINYSKIVTIKDVTIRHGKKSGAGGGIKNKGTLTLTNSTICNNSTTGSYSSGGGIHNIYGTLTVTNSTICNNAAPGSSSWGGGFLNQGTSTFINPTIYGNSSVGGYGGGISNRTGTVTLQGCNICNNTGSEGDGIFINGNTLNICNTVVANNGTSDYHVKSAGTLVDNGYNIIENQTGSGSPSNWKFTATTNILYNYKADGTSSTSWNRNNTALGNQNLNLSTTLADNSTLNGSQTLALLSGSFAIDAGTNTGAQTSDQRGVYRYGTTDIGAYEYDGIFTIVWDGSESADWNTAENWNVSDVPSSPYDVTIPTVAKASAPIIGASGTASCNNLTINDGASLTVESDASGSGSLITDGTITNNGTVDIKRYISEDVWHLISAPNNVSTANTFDGDFLQTWDEASAEWLDITQATTALIPAQGYGLWATSKATTYTFTGTPTSGEKTIAMTSAGGGDNDGMNLLGNPYPSSIDWDVLVETYGAVYYWDSENSHYDTWSGSGATNGGQQYLPPMQGFFVYTTTAKDFTINNTARTHENTSSYYKSGGDNISHGIRLEASNNVGLKNDMLLLFDNESQAGFEL